MKDQHLFEVLKKGLEGKKVIKRYKKNETILSPGKVLDKVTYLNSGYIRVYIITPDGEEVTVVIISPGCFLPLISLTSKEENRYYFEALTSVETWQIVRQEIYDLLMKDPDALMRTFMSSTFRYRSLLMRVEYLITGDAYEKVASLIFSIVRHFKTEDGSYMSAFSLPHRLIASMTGLTRETVTLQILKLEKRGLVNSKKGRIIVKDLEALKKESIFANDSYEPYK